VIIERLDLEAAIAAGIISRQQADRLRDLSEQGQAGPDAPLDFSQGVADEPFRLNRGFRDIFVAIGLVIFGAGVSALALSFAINFNTSLGFWDPIENSRIWPIPITALLLAYGFVQAEIVTRRQRLPLSSAMAAIAFVAWSAMFCGAIALNYATSAPRIQSMMFDSHGSAILWAMLAGAMAGTVAFYWRYRLPFCLAMLAGLLVVLSFAVLDQFLDGGWFERSSRDVLGAWGILVFLAAMWFDMKDRFRVTRLSECAFWLHLLAAPLLVHSFLMGDRFGEQGAGFLFAAVAILSVVALVIDRRALLVSGLGYLVVAVFRLISDSALSGGYKVAITAFVIGGFLLALGLGWAAIRRTLLKAMPWPWLKARVPPADSADAAATLTSSQP
jgi:hypothetical protein